jgi:hypothetical protein
MCKGWAYSALAPQPTVVYCAFVHSIISNYGKFTGNMCNLPYSEKPFISRIAHSLMNRQGLSVSDIEDYLLFIDIYYSSV